MDGNAIQTKGASAPFPLSELTSVLSYDETSGVFVWLVDQKRRQVKAGEVAGHIHNVTGYVTIGYRGNALYGHTLAWYFKTGEWLLHIDHKNRIRHDNAFENLRRATQSQNRANTKTHAKNTSGFRGVTFDKRRGSWNAEVRFEKVRHRQNGFASAAEAGEWAEAKRKDLFKEFNPTEE